jgi:hypothetical protein
MRLYTWNTAVSAAFYGPLQGLEVALRNAMHRSLAARYGPDWYDNPACQFDAGTLHRIGNAKDKLRRDGHTVDPPHVVAALPFGFWVALLGHGGKSAVLGTPKRNYEMTLWRPCLHLASRTRAPAGPRCTSRSTICAPSAIASRTTSRCSPGTSRRTTRRF